MTERKPTAPNPTKQDQPPERLYVRRTTNGAWIMSFSPMGDDDIFYAPDLTKELLEALESAMWLLSDIYSPLNQQNSPTFDAIKLAMRKARGRV